MISRVAESCFWLHRYIERMENTARLLRVNRAFVLDVSLPDHQRWRPVIVVAGEEERFDEQHSPAASNDGEIVQDYLVWNEGSPVSILSSLKWARENARSIRDVISLEAWEAVNGMWHWMRSAETRSLYHSDRDEFYAHIKRFSALFQGVCQGTMLREQPFDFMRLGRLLERVGQTARILDVGYHAASMEPYAGLDHDGPSVSADGAGGSDDGAGVDLDLDAGLDSAVEAARCLALLRSCSASEPFLKLVRQTPQIARIAAFLILEPRFPRSVLHCIDRATALLATLRGDRPIVPGDSLTLLTELGDSLRAHDEASLVEVGVHAELTRVIDTTTLACSALHSELFDPVHFSLPSVSEAESQ